MADGKPHEIDKSVIQDPDFYFPQVVFIGVGRKRLWITCVDYGLPSDCS